ncbi:hypothetical protein [Paenibacillus hamazuiensis]|uniref:hypothetical protein n=1 Tax=Paenibacillus hamazuiensis TaxID=2936508 RepID=UPI00200D7DBD|nr:hypothetical protein [Paenibacillus hamazuiensis]
MPFLWEGALATPTPGSLFERHFIRSYTEAGGQLPERWPILAKLNDLISLCELLNHSSGAPNRVRDLVRLIHGILQEYDR